MTNILFFGIEEMTSFKQEPYDMLVFYQSNKCGYIVFKEKNILAGEVYHTDVEINQNDLLKIFSNLELYSISPRQIYLQLDFEKTLLIPAEYFEADNIVNYYKKYYPELNSPIVDFVYVEEQDCYMIFNLNERIKDVSKFSIHFGNVEIIPSEMVLLLPIQYDIENQIQIYLKENSLQIAWMKNSKLMNFKAMGYEFHAEILDLIAQNLNDNNLYPTTNTMIVLQGEEEICSIIQSRMKNNSWIIAEPSQIIPFEIPSQLAYFSLFPFVPTLKILACEL